jgi:hypothetical protein
MAEVQSVRQLPPEFIEAASKTYIDDLQKAVGDFKTQDLSQIMGRQFIAGPGALTTQAEGLAPGLGGFQPFLQQAEQLRGPTAFQAYMSPFQQDVIDTTLAEFDRQTQAGLPSLAAQAVGAGAFGGGREGVQRAEFLSNQARNRAALQAQLLGQGFTQAQNLAAQDFTRNIQLAQQAPALVGQQIAGLTTLGGQQQARAQQQLAADQQLAQRQAFQPLEAAQTLGSGIVPLISGYPGAQKTVTTPSPSALQTGLSTGATLAGIYRLIRG